MRHGFGVSEALEQGVVTGPQLRQVMGRFATGVAVVTTAVDGVASGMTVNSLTSVSLEPPVVLVCLNTHARTTIAIMQRGAFAVSVLSVRQEHLARRFAGRGEDHFDGLIPVNGRSGLPQVPGALAHVTCAVSDSLIVGDHRVVFGLVKEAEERPGEPLVFLGGRFGNYLDRERDADPWFF